jgi:hypothetical protein
VKWIFLIFVLWANNGVAQDRLLTKDYTDPLSTASFFVTTARNNRPMKIATGFLLMVKDRIYFITNNHVVGGEHMQREYHRIYGKLMPPDSMPNQLVVRFPTDELSKFVPYNISINDAPDAVPYIKFYENELNPSSILDIVAIDITKLRMPADPLITFFRPQDFNDSLILNVTEPLFVVGFPGEFQGRIPYPVYKSATIASEPNLIAAGESIFLVDATTRQGMSGSPVVFYGTRIRTATRISERISPVRYLIGIYSAQIMGSELGVVTRLNKVLDKLQKLSR